MNRIAEGNEVNVLEKSNWINKCKNTTEKIANAIGFGKKEELPVQQTKIVEEKISAVIYISPSIEKIIEGIKICIESENDINIETVEELCEGCSTELYLKNYKKILKRIEYKLIEYQDHIDVNHKNELERIIETDGQKRELRPEQLATFVNYLLKYDNKQYMITKRGIYKDDIFDLCIGKSTDNTLKNILM